MLISSLECLECHVEEEDIDTCRVSSTHVEEEDIDKDHNLRPTKALDKENSLSPGLTTSLLVVTARDHEH